MSDPTPRELVVTTVTKRAAHIEIDQVTDTLSNWSAERIVTDEYHGRFLIELLQNARDALRRADPAARTGVVRVCLTPDPALVVCNDGAPLTPHVLLHSIGKLGLGTKPHGEAIGHKGIGFKSVLDLSLTPEIYSCQDDGRYGLRVRFDPRDARALVRRYSPDWVHLVAKAPGSDGAASEERIPVLRFPIWVDDESERLRGVEFHDGRLFDTVVRLPFDERFAGDLNVSEEGFVENVRAAMKALSDQMVLLLSAFGTVLLEDEISGDVTIVTQEDLSIAPLAAGGKRRMVVVRRNGAESSRWILFERSLEGLPGLEGDITVGVRVLPVDEGAPRIVAPVVWPGDAGEDFHLFFPTRIATHVPLLLHAYFEVKADRERFATTSGADVRNRLLLDGLRGLARDAVASLISDDAAGRLDMAHLATLLADGGQPGDELAADFRDKLLADLDLVEWAPAMPLAGLSSYARPVDLLAEPDVRLADLLPVAFPPTYLHRRTGLRYPDPRVSPDGIAFLARRVHQARSTGRQGIGASELRELLTPGELPIWEPLPDAMDGGFVAIVNVLDLTRTVRPETAGVVEALADEPAARFIPVLDEDPPYRRLRPPTGPGRSGERGSTWILARLGQSFAPLVAPPRALGLDFLADGLLDDRLLSAAQPLGIREYRTETVLDALAAGERTGDGARAVTRFAWRLLLRDSSSSYSVSKVAEVAGVFDPPGRWFWSRPGLRSDNERDELRRARGLARLVVPTRDGGEWRAADQLAFGLDWATWAAERAGRHAGGADESRAEAYRDQEAIGPDAGVFLGPPDAMIDAFPVTADDAREIGIADLDPQGARDRHVDLVHAFLLRIGVWEIPPVDSINDLSVRGDDGLDPWAGTSGREAHRRQLERSGDFASYHHRRVHVGEDYRLRWPMTASVELARSLGRGVDLYNSCTKTFLFCPGCQTHRTRYDNLQERQRPSLLRHQVDFGHWVPVTVGAGEVDPARPLDAWTDDDVPDPSRMHLSSLRFVPLVPTEFPSRLAGFAGITTIETATFLRVGRMLRSLKVRQSEFVGAGSRQGTDEGRAFVSLHRRLYERFRQLQADLIRQLGPDRVRQLGTDGMRKQVAERLGGSMSDTGVLVTEGTILRFVPPDQARHDDGQFTAYKKHFVGRVPFLAVKADQGRIASALGAPRFELDIKRSGDDRGHDVTDRVRTFIHDRAVEMLAIVCFYPLGGQTLELDSRRFRERAQRLAALQVRQVEDLELEVRVIGFDVSATIGAGRNEDLFVEGARTTSPVLYHDLPGDRWEDRFRRLVGPHLAAILENDAYATVFRLLVEQDTEAEIASFLLELGIGDDQVKEVADLVESTSRVVRGEEERWWRALLPLLNVDLEVDTADLAWRDHLREALAAASLLETPQSIGLLLLRRPGTDGARADIEPGGVLARLEAHKVDIEAFDRALRRLGDRGLDVRGPERRLDSWRRAHASEVVAVLEEKKDSEATNRPPNWRLPAELDWVVTAQPGVFLRPVIDDLERFDLGPIDSAELVGADVGQYLAGLVALDAGQLLERWHARHGLEGQNVLLGDQAVAWRRVLRPVIVAGRVLPGSPGYEIRAEAATVDREFAGIDTPGDIADLLDLAMPRSAALGQALAEFVRSHRAIGVPSADDVMTFAAQHVADPTHLERVRTVLAIVVRDEVDRVRRGGAALRSTGIEPTPVSTTAKPIVPRGPTKRQHVRPGTRGRSDTGKLGAAAEAWALSAVIQALLDMPPPERYAAVRAMDAKLREHFESDVVDGLSARAKESLDSVEDDEAVDSLIRFVHVSKASDDFGFDLIGYLPGTIGQPPDVLFLEVKSSTGRSFIVSTHEWDVSEREDLRESYAFLVVQRGPDGQPKAMEILRDPPGLLAEGRVTRNVKDWGVEYLLETSAGSGVDGAEATARNAAEKAAHVGRE